VGTFELKGLQEWEADVNNTDAERRLQDVERRTTHKASQGQPRSVLTGPPPWPYGAHASPPLCRTQAPVTCRNVNCQFMYLNDIKACMLRGGTVSLWSKSQKQQTTGAEPRCKSKQC
jgi:hypothetical protein